MEVLQTKSLKKHYRQSEIVVKAIDGVDISVSHGEFVAIVGSSGSGKTTTIKAIVGIHSRA